MKQLNKKRRLVITSHAHKRAEEFNISTHKLVWLFWNSQVEKLPKDLRKMAAAKYEKHQSVTRYLRNETYVMVAGEAVHKKYGDEIYLLLTIYDQRLDLPARLI